MFPWVLHAPLHKRRGMIRNKLRSYSEQKKKLRSFEKNKFPWGNTRFFVTNTFISNARLNLVKIKQKLSNTLRLNFHYLKTLPSKNKKRYSKKKLKKNKCVCFNDVIWLIVMKMRLEIKNTIISNITMIRHK